MGSKDDIITLPNAKLRQRSQKISFVTPDIVELVEAMKDAAIDWENSRTHEVSVALAAVQIGELRRVVVVRNNFEDKSDHSFTVFINPEITKYEGVIETDYEGCLSVKSIYGKVPRHTKVRVKAMGLNGKTIRLTAEGFLARIFQHEIDHTNGIVFIDHIRDSEDAFFKLDEAGELATMDFVAEVKDAPDLWED